MFYTPLFLSSTNDKFFFNPFQQVVLGTFYGKVFKGNLLEEAGQS